MSPWKFTSITDCPRTLYLKFGQNWVTNSWDISDMDKCRQDKCCLEKCCSDSWKENFCELQREAHKGVKYPCRQCLKPFSQKGNLGQHQRQVYEGGKYQCNKCSYQATTNKSWLNIIGKCMEESNTFVVNVIKNFLRENILLNIKGHM